MEVVNGSLVIDNNYMYRPNDVIEVECNKGYMPYHEMATCTPDGSWRPEPRCIRKYTERKRYLFLLSEWFGQQNVLSRHIHANLVVEKRKVWIDYGQSYLFLRDVSDVL